MTAPEPLPTAVDRAATWGMVAAALLLTAGLASTLDRVQYGTGVDEGHYLVYAKLIARDGAASLPDLFRDYVGDESRWRYPNPLRLGFIGITGLWARAVGPSYAALSQVSLASYLLAVLAVYAFMRRLLGNPRALLIALLCAFSPLWMGLARRAMVDGCATLLGVLAIGAYLEVLRRPERRLNRVLFALAFGFGILVKETTILLAVPFVASLAIERARRGPALPLAPFAGMLALPPLACAGIWTLAAGGDAGTVVQLVRIIVASPATNPYAHLAGGGPWFRYLIDFLVLSPWPTLLAVASFGVLAARAREGRVDPTLVHLAVVVVGVLLAYSFFTKNVRYVAVLELPIRALAVCGLWELVRSAPLRRAAALCGVVVAALCWLDYRAFRLFFLDGALYDPVTVMLLAIRGMLPTQ